jgi:hypothetical protein
MGDRYPIVRPPMRALPFQRAVRQGALQEDFEGLVHSARPHEQRSQELPLQDACSRARQESHRRTAPRGPLAQVQQAQGAAQV